MKKSSGILFPKGSESKCVKTLDFGKNRLCIEGKVYKHPEDNCIIDENGNEFFIPHSLIQNFINQQP